MNIFKIVLTVLILLQTIYIVPSMSMNINNDIQKMLIFIFIILLSMVEPTIALLITILITINTKNMYIEKMFTPLYNSDLKNIIHTIHIEEPIESQNKQQPKQQCKKTNLNTIKTEKVECDKDLIISESMLHNIQNNIFDEKNISKYPNETKDVNVNIQGIFDRITGYSSPPF